MRSLKFENLYFGEASAEREAEKDPERFLRTYYIANSKIRADYQSRARFLIIGPKGSGKSSVSEYLRLSLIKNYGSHAVFTRTLDLDEVSPGLSPLSTMTTKLVSDQAASITDSAWRLYIALHLFDLLMKDETSSLSRNPGAVGLQHKLRSIGLAEDDFPSVLRKVRENRFKLDFKFFGGERSTREGDEVPVKQLGDALLRRVCDAESDNHFMLSIDGLDKIIGENRAYWLTLAALIRVAEKVTIKLINANSNIRILVMCRSDVFRRIKFSDADKISGDASLFLDWAAEQTSAVDSPLWDYLSSKAEISVEQLFELLPSQVTVGQRTGRKKIIPIAEYLIQSTRSTPREMTRLMANLQEQLPPGGYLDSDRVRRGVDNFVTRDLITTVTAEATGLLREELHDELHTVISRLPHATNLNFTELSTAVIEAGLTADLTNELAEFMFLAGLLGNYDSKTGYVQFYHRRDTHKFKPAGPWMLHKGLMYAFNIPYGKARPPQPRTRR